MSIIETAEHHNNLIKHTNRLKIGTTSKNAIMTEKSIEGEMRVYQLLSKYFPKVHTHVVLKANDRLFVEIDFLVELPHLILLFEVKNWYGTLVLSESDHRKVTLSRVNHLGKYTEEVRDNPVFTISAFRDDLRKYYKNRHGITGSTLIEKYVVFTNRDLTLIGLENITTTTGHLFIDQLADEIKAILKRPINQQREWPGQYPS